MDAVTNYTIVNMYDVDGEMRTIKVYEKDFNKSELGSRSFDSALTYFDDNGIIYEVL